MNKCLDKGGIFTNQYLEKSLCNTCMNFETCMYKAKNQSILQCEEYQEDKVAVIYHDIVDRDDDSDVEIKKTDYSNSKVSQGLCCFCDGKDDCIYMSEGKVIYFCEMYE